MKRKSSKAIVIIFLSVAVLFGLIMFSCRIREFDNFEAYKKAGLYVSYVTPEEISSFKGVSRHIGPMGGMDAYSISVTDEQYEEIVARLTEDLNLVSEDEEDLKYGNASFYGMKVGAINARTPDYDLDDFNESDLFQYVTDVPVNEYTVIYFSPTGTGGIEQGVFFFPGTNTMIFYRTKSR